MSVLLAASNRIDRISNESLYTSHISKQGRGEKGERRKKFKIVRNTVAH
jgi:hypothetical protein